MSSVQPDRRRRLGNRIVRHPRQQEISPVHVEPAPLRVPPPPRGIRSPFVLAYGLGVLIVAGAFVLWLPAANTQGDFTPFSTALFTAVSAVTDTGLVVVDTATYWSLVGQVTIMALVFLGGLGMMTVATFLAIIIGQRITLANRLLMRESFGVNQLGGLVRLTRNIVIFTVAAQIVGFLLLFWRFLAVFPAPTAAWQAAFHSVTAFNNAGFSIIPQSDNLTSVKDSVGLLAIFASLIIVGGISFSVIWDLFRFRRFFRFTLDTRMVLIASLLLWVIGALVFFLAEYGNASTLGPMSVSDKGATALFHSVSARTAGFNTIDFGNTQQFTNFFIIALMFVGAASGSTAGGIKINTLAVIVAAVASTAIGRPRVEAFHRGIPIEQVLRAVAVATLSLVLVFVAAFFLNMTEQLPFLDVFFEVVSAFGTVGLSAGVTSQLSLLGQIVIMATMFFGRLGPLTFALALAQREDKPTYQYAEERVKIG